MKACDLMPGDLVKSFGVIEEVFMVDASSEDEKDQLINYRSASEFEPITLTPNILRKNGFKEEIGEDELIFTYTLTKKEAARLSRDNEEEVDYSGYIIKLYVSFTESGEEPELSILDICTSLPIDYVCTSLPIDYVHDLQHYMKQIKLDKKIIQ